MEALEWMGDSEIFSYHTKAKQQYYLLGNIHYHNINVRVLMFITNPIFIFNIAFAIVLFNHSLSNDSLGSDFI